MEEILATVRQIIADEPDRPTSVFPSIEPNPLVPQSYSGGASTPKASPPDVAPPPTARSPERHSSRRIAALDEPARVKAADVVRSGSCRHARRRRSGRGRVVVCAEACAPEQIRIWFAGEECASPLRPSQLPRPLRQKRQLPPQFASSDAATASAVRRYGFVAVVASLQRRPRARSDSAAQEAELLPAAAASFSDAVAPSCGRAAKEPRRRPRRPTSQQPTPAGSMKR